MKSELPGSPGHTAIADWLRAAALRDGRRVYLDDVDSGRRVTFAEVEDRVRHLANALLERGIARGDRIGIVATDCHGYIETLWASMRIGAIFVPLNVRLTNRELADLLDHAGAKILFVSADQASRVLGLIERVGSLTGAIAYEPTEQSGVEDYETVLGRSSAADIRIRVEDDDPLGLAFTSGTTGLPKAVVQSQRMVKWIVATSVLGWETRAGEFYYSGAPLFHISGMAMVLMGALMNYTSVLTRRFRPDEFLELVRDRRITSAFLVPTMIGLVLEQEKAATYGKGLRAIHYGAAPMPVALLHRAIEAFDCDFVQSFGAGTESGWNCALTTEDHRRAVAGEEHLLRSVGRPAPGVELRICDDDWNDVASGTVGEVVVRSDEIMSGYLGQPEETARSMHPDGWFRAGDLAYRDEEGFIYLVDRKKDMIVRGGENIFPAEVERVLYTYPGVLECAVVGAPDPKWGEVPVAHLVLRAGVRPPDPQVLFDYCTRHLAKFKIPSEWRFRSSMPKTASGKILKREIAREHRDETT